MNTTSGGRAKSWYNLAMELTKETIMYLRYVHGTFNMGVALLVFYQLRLGLGMKKARVSGAADPLRTKRHRRLGPFAVAAGILGFTAGMALIVLDKGRVLAYPLHFVAGGVIALGLIYAFILSGKMGSGDSSARTLHGKVGVATTVIYVVQVLLGLGILL